MRDILTGLAIGLIVALTTALVAPYLVDWNSQRAFLEARLSHAFAQKVTIGGDIDLKLLPTPYLVLDQTVIGGDDGPIRMGIRHLDLQLSVAPLLHGEFDIIDATLREPTIRVTLEPDRSLPALPDAPAFDANLRFDRIEVENGTIAIADPRSGRTFVSDHLDLTAEAPSLGGPFKGSGAGGAPGGRTNFHFATTAAQESRARAHLVVEETSAHAGIDLDGVVTLAHAEAATVRPIFDGALALSGHIRRVEGDPLGWRLVGPLRADSQRADLTGGELRIGDDDAGLRLQAEGQASLGSAPKLTLAVSAKQLDIDRLSGPVAENGVVAPPRLPDLATLRGLVMTTPWISTDLDVRVDGATYGGETLSHLSAHIGLGGKGPRHVQVAGNGPGGLYLDMDGALTSGFDGRFGVRARNLTSALTWISEVAPDLGLTKATLPFDKAKAAGHLAVDATGVTATDLNLSLDRSDLTGTAHVASATPTHPAVIEADLRASSLDLDALPDLAALRGPMSPFDFDLKLDANAIKVSRFGDGTLQAGHLAVALTRSGQRIIVSKFQADDLGGATIVGTGRADADTATLMGTVDAAKLGDAVTLFHRLAPGRIAEALAVRAHGLAPANVKIMADFGAGDTGVLGVTRLQLSGRLAATTIDVHLGPDPQMTGRLTLDATADAPEGGALLGQFGFETLPLNLIGHSHVSVVASGASREPLDTRGAATFGGTRVSMNGRFDLLGRAHGGSGMFAVKGDDIGPLLQSLALAFPDMTGRIPIDMSGGVALAETGVALSDLKGTVGGTLANGALKWQAADGRQPVLTGALDLDRLSLGGLLGLSLGPTQPGASDGPFSTLPFSAGLVDPPRSALKLKARVLDLGIGHIATDATFDLGIAPNLVALQQFTAALDGGHVTADLTLRRDGGQAALVGKLGADGVALDWPSLTAKLTGHLDIAGSGASASALVSSLAGGGDATLAQVTVPDTDPGALPHLFDAVEADELSVDTESVSRAFDAAERGRFNAGSRTVDLGLAAGVLRWTAATDDTQGPVANAIEGMIDLRTWQTDQTLTQTLNALPKGWTGPPPAIAMSWRGPLDAPKRSIDVANFLNAVTARALAREMARVEAYEFDIRERAFFNARLQADRRRDEDRAAVEAARLAAEKAAADKAAVEKANEPATAQ